MDKIKKSIGKLMSHSLWPKTAICKTIKIVNEDGRGAEIDFGYNVRQFKCKNGCEHHNHMVCMLCGTYTYIDDEGLEDFQDKLAKLHGFTPQKHNFKIFGTCEKCQ